MPDENLPQLMEPAEVYERMLAASKFGPLAERVLAIAPPSAGARVLDVAAGTGIVSRKIAQLGFATFSLTCVDSNPGMLEVGKKYAAIEGVEIDWHVSPAERLPFDDRSFDYIYCQQGLQFFKNRLAALKEMHRVLDQNGRAIISTWKCLDSHPYARMVDEAGYEAASIHILRDPHSLHDPAEIKRLIEEAGFRDVALDSISLLTDLGDPERAIRLNVRAVTAAIPSLQGLSEQERVDLTEVVVARTRFQRDQFVVDGTLRVNWESNVAIATK